MTPAVIIDDLKKRLQAKELARIRQMKSNADAWNKLDAHQEQMLLRRYGRSPFVIQIYIRQPKTHPILSSPAR